MPPIIVPFSTANNVSTAVHCLAVKRVFKKKKNLDENAPIRYHGFFFLNIPIQHDYGEVQFTILYGTVRNEKRRAARALAENDSELTESRDFVCMSLDNNSIHCIMLRFVLQSGSDTCK